MNSDVPSPLDEAGKLIDAGYPISSLYKHFPSREEALKYYAEFQNSKHPAECSTDACSICGGASPSTQRTAFIWRAFFGSRLSPRFSDLLFLFIGIISISSKYKVIDFCTTHPICDACWRKLRIKRALANVCHFLALFIAFPGLIFAPVGIGGIFTVPHAKEKWGYAGIALSGIAMLLLAFGLGRLVPRLRMPPATRPIGQRPFFSSVVKRSEK